MEVTVLRFFAFVAGLAMILYFFKSVIRVGILNQRYVDSLAFWVSRSVWRLFQFRVKFLRGDPKKEHLVMAWYWPCTLVAVITSWFLLVTLGFALLNWAFGANPTFVEAFISSGSALSTLGFSTPPAVSGQFFAIIEGAIGLFLIVYLFTFLPGFMELIYNRGSRISWLYERAGKPPSGAGLITWFYLSGRPDQLDEMAEDWAIFFRDLKHAKTFQPILAVVRPLNPEESWVSAFGVFLDALALLKTTVNRNAKTSEICFAQGVEAIQAIHESMRGTPLVPRQQPGLMHVHRDQYDTACQMLRLAEVPLNEDLDQAWLDFIEHHKRYEQEISWLAATLGSPEPEWPQQFVQQM